MKTVYLTSFDKKIYKQSTVVVKTFIENYNENVPADFYCLVPDTLLEKESEFVDMMGDTKNVNVKFICSPKFLEFKEKSLLPGTRHITSNVWQRVFISSLFPEHDRAVYIDADTIILRDLSPLINYPQTNKMMAKVEISSSAQEAFGTQDMVYFNAGVFITDLNFWREEKIEEKILSHVEKNGVGKFLEQDLFNIYFAEVFSPIPEAFNFGAWQYEIFVNQNAITNPLIVHWMGEKKPWLKFNSNDPWKQIWRDKFFEIVGESCEDTETEPAVYVQVHRGNLPASAKPA